MKVEKVILRRHIMAALSVSSDTVRRWIKGGKIPKPDIAITDRTAGWSRSTLEKAGINLPAAR